MCGICNLVRCITGRNNRGCGNLASNWSNDANNNNCSRVNRQEPCMKHHCASGVGQSNQPVCGCEQNCGCDCGCDCD